jgi:hypothetical protein
MRDEEMANDYLSSTSAPNSEAVPCTFLVKPPSSVRLRSHYIKGYMV